MYKILHKPIRNKPHECRGIKHVNIIQVIRHTGYMHTRSLIRAAFSIGENKIQVVVMMYSGKSKESR